MEDTARFGTEWARRIYDSVANSFFLGDPSFSNFRFWQKFIVSQFRITDTAASMISFLKSLGCEFPYHLKYPGGDIVRIVFSKPSNIFRMYRRPPPITLFPPNEAMGQKGWVYYTICANLTTGVFYSSFPIAQTYPCDIAQNAFYPRDIGILSCTGRLIGAKCDSYLPFDLASSEEAYRRLFIPRLESSPLDPELRA